MQAADAGHDHAPHHATGLPWLDIVIGVSAMFISVVSLVVSVQHGRTMEKMADQNEKLVAASTMPFLSEFGTQLDPATLKPSLRLTLKNGGVGPAVIDWFQFQYRGKAYDDPKQFLHDCCAKFLPPPGQNAGLVYSNVSGTIMPARDTLDVLELTSQSPVELQAAVNSARNDLTFTACYCSVLDECWQTDFRAARPKPVASCKTMPSGPLW